MKKLLALILSLMLMLSFTACGSKDKDADTKTAATEDAKDVETDADAEDEEETYPGQDIIESFLEAIVTFNFEEAASYECDVDASALPFANIDEVKQTFAETLGETVSDEYMDAFLYFIDAYVTAYSDNIEYSIDDVAEEDDKITYTLTMYHPDMTSLDMEAMEDELAAQLLESGDITEDSSEDEIFLAMYEPMSEAFAEAIENADTLTDTVTLVLVDVDGEYLISDSESDAGMFMDALMRVAEFSF